MLSIPCDVYESPHEIVIIMPLAGVLKDSIDIRLNNHQLIISGERQRPQLKEDLLPVQEECYRGEWKQSLDIPPHIVLHDIHSKLSRDNILTLILPKTKTPEKIQIEIDD